MSAPEEDAERARLTRRYHHQMEARRAFLEEERERCDSVEDGMRELKLLSGPYIAVGDTTVVAIVERLEHEAKALREEKLKGIPAPDPAEKDAGWLRASAQELWDEKLQFGQRRPLWEALILRVDTELQRVQDMGPPKAPAPEAAASGSAAGAGGDLDLDLDL